ncbi:hypothetical protein D3C84_639440 [compost metagenome]
MRHFLHHRPQPHLRPRQTLRQPRQRQRRQRPQSRITANGLPIIEQHNRLPVRRHLHRTQRNTFGNHGFALVLQRCSQQAHTHAVGATVEGPGAVERIEQALAAELADLRAEYHVQWQIGFEVRYLFARQLAHQQWRFSRIAQRRAFG